ncbi:MAG: CAP domain-containing protein [bacterium]
MIRSLKFATVGAIVTFAAFFAFQPITGFGATTPTPTATKTPTSTKTATFSKTPTVNKSITATPVVTVTPVLPDNAKTPKDFWAKGFQAKWISQTQAGTTDQYYAVLPGDSITVQAVFQNVGAETWFNAPAERQVCINVYKDKQVISAPVGTGYDDPASPKFGRSYWADPSWAKEDYRLGCILENSVATGQVGTFSLKFLVPANTPAGKYREDITLAAGAFWMAADAAYPQGTGDPLGAAHIWVGLNVGVAPTVLPTVTPTATPIKTPTVAELEAYALKVLNDSRVAKGLPVLSANVNLAKAARDHSVDMDKTGMPSAFGINGSTVQQRIAKVGVSCPCDENETILTIDKTQVDPYNFAVKSSTDFFLGISPYKDLILSTSYTKIGIGVVINGDKISITYDFAK